MHNIINYEKYNTICKTHLETYNSYCKICKENLCIVCEKGHINHEKIYFGNILPDPDDINFKFKELDKYINEFNESIDDIIDTFKVYKENINNFYQIYTDIIKNAETKKRSYEILNNIIEINNNQVIIDIKNIVKEKNIKKKINLILDICNTNEILSRDEITLVYKNNINNFIHLFSEEFIQNNKNICKIIYENKKYEIKSYFDVQNNKDELIFKIRGINYITNTTKMFYGCEDLISLPDINKWNLINVIEMNDMFTGCNKSLIIPKQFTK